MVLPSTLTILSPGLIPARSAALLACTVSAIGTICGRPISVKTAANTRMARMKFASGPAATTAKRFQSGAKWNNPTRSASGVAANLSGSGTLAALSSPSKRT